MKRAPTRTTLVIGDDVREQLIAAGFRLNQSIPHYAVPVQGTVIWSYPEGDGRRYEQTD